LVPAVGVSAGAAVAFVLTSAAVLCLLAAAKTRITPAPEAVVNATVGPASMPQARDVQPGSGMAGESRRDRRRWARPLAAVLVIGAAAGGASAARLAAVSGGPVASMARSGEAAWLEMVVTGDPQPIPSRTDRVDRVKLQARLERVRNLRVRLPVIVLADAASWREVAPSSRLRAFGRLLEPQRIDGTAAVISARGRPILQHGPSAIQREATGLRAGLRNAVSALRPAERGLVPGIVVGDTSQMPEELSEQFKRAGLTHLLAVSGANLMILVGFLLGLARVVGIRDRLPPLLALGSIVGFVVLARPQPSVLRAAVMAVIVIAATLTGRQRAGLSSLCVAVCVLLLIDPWLARSYGFALSALATGGILVLAPRWADRICGRGVRSGGSRSGTAGRLRRLLAESLAVPAAAQVACLPVLVMLAGQVSLIAVFANLLVAPAVAPTTILGLLAAVSAPASQSVAAFLGHLAGLPASWIVRVAALFAELPGAVLPWPSGPLGALAAVGFLVVGAVMARRVRRAPLVVLTCAAAAVVLVLRPSLSLGWPPPGWVIVACDVGQGDALVLRLAAHSGVLVDAGPDPRPVDRCLRDLGVRTLPLVVLSHFHSDHVAGLPGVLNGRAIGEIVVSPLDDPAENAVHVRRWAARAGVRVRAAVAGETWQVGPARLTVLGPRVLLGGGQVNGEGSAANNASVVLLAELRGVRLLLTGDIEPPAQAALLSGGGDLHADVYKVPHHGSTYQDSRLLAAVRPRVALVCVGAGNDYGQPAPSTVSALKGSGAAVLRTDERGDVAVVAAGQALRAIARGRLP
jgi:competence protein ComEC